MKNNSSRKRVIKRKHTTEDSHFAFISDIEEDVSLSLEEKIILIQKTLTSIKTNLNQSKKYPTWITKESTKNLLSVLNIDPSDKFKFFESKDQEQNQFKQLLFKLLELNKKYSYTDMSELIDKHVDLFSKYKFPNKGSVMNLIVAIQQLLDKKDKCNQNGEILLTGLYNAIFHQIYQMNDYEVRGDVLKGISFEEGQPLFQVKCNSYTYSDDFANVLSIREDKASLERDWEKISTDGYKAIIVSRAVLRENLRKFSMESFDILRYSKFLAITTNIEFINCFLLECSFDDEWNPSYHLSNLRCIAKLGDPNQPFSSGLVCLVEFVCRYTRDYMTCSFKRSDDGITIGRTPMKHNTHSQLSHVSTILRSTLGQTPVMLNKRAVLHAIQGNVWVAKSALVLKKVEYERYIYAVLLAQQVYCPFLPFVLKYGTDYMQLEKLEEIEYNNNWDENELISLLFDMSCALKYLHSINIIHRDVKPNNILLRTGKDDYFAYVLIDFGLSCHFERTKDGLLNLHTRLMINENCGTTIFRAPEVVNKQNYSERIDIFSLGMTAMYLLDSDKMNRAYEKKKNCNWFDTLMEFNIAEPLKNVIGQMIHEDPTERPTAEQLEKIFDNFNNMEK